MTRQQLALAAPAAVVATGLGLVAKPALEAAVRQAITGWRNDPKGSLIDLGLALVYGQGVMWTIGQDFIGVGMNPKWRPGIGHKLAPKIAAKLPHTTRVYWLVKVVEIASDATKMPLEGRLLRRVGVVPDVVAQAIPQPLWSFIEVVEKLVGLVRYPERVTTPEQLEDSISSIYGTWTRNLAGLVLLRYGPGWRRWLRAKLDRS